MDNEQGGGFYNGGICTVRVLKSKTNFKREKKDDKGGNSGILVHAPLLSFPSGQGQCVILGTKKGKIVYINKVTVPKPLS